MVRIVEEFAAISRRPIKPTKAHRQEFQHGRKRRCSWPIKLGSALGKAALMEAGRGDNDGAERVMIQGRAATHRREG